MGPGEAGGQGEHGSARFIYSLFPVAPPAPQVKIKLSECAQNINYKTNRSSSSSARTEVKTGHKAKLSNFVKMTAFSLGRA